MDCISPKSDEKELSDRFKNVQRELLVIPWGLESCNLKNLKVEQSLVQKIKATFPKTEAPGVVHGIGLIKHGEAPLPRCLEKQSKFVPEITH